MKWVKASERLPQKEAPYFIRNSDGADMMISYYRKRGKSYLRDHKNTVEWLDESIPASLEQEAEKLYPYPDEDEMGNSIIDCMRSAHITAARQYMGEIDTLKGTLRKMWQSFVRPALAQHDTQKNIDALYEEFKQKHNL